MMHSSSSYLALAAVLLISHIWTARTSTAQDASGQGVLLVNDWPDEETKHTGRFEILPFIDTLSIAYRHREIDGRPDLSIVLEWMPSQEGIFQGRRTRLAEIEGAPAIVGLELAAEVYSEGRHVAEFSLTVDSMVVEPSPDLILIEVPQLNWDNVFVNTPGDVARQIFVAGFELRNPTIVSAGFAWFEDSRRVAETAVEKRKDRDGRRPPRVVTRRPRHVSIYRYPGHIDVALDLFWLIGSNSRRIRSGDDGPRENIGRGSLGGDRRSRSGRGEDTADRGRSGRGEDTADSGRSGLGENTADSGRSGRGEASSGRSGRIGVSDAQGAADDAQTGARGEGDRRRGGDQATQGDDSSEGAEAKEERGKRRSRTGIPGLGKSDDDDDDDDDDNKLVPYAVAAVAAAAVLAAVGGTVGYYGNARYAPYGITSGIVRDDGGLLLQVAVNDALLAGEGGPKRLTGRALSFGDMFGNGTIQPALGAGVMATSRGGEVEYEPSLSLGAVGRHSMLLLYGGYDVLNGSAEFSVAVDLRRTGLFGKKER